MSRFFCSRFASSVTLLAASVLLGCNGGQPAAPAPSTTSTTAAADVHDHPTEGPHHGDLVELGNEEYHAEIVHGTGGEVTIYILDSKATTAVPIDATEVVINLSHDGNAEQFKLPAAADSGDPAGKSSRFTLKDEELASDLDSEGTAAKIVIKINGKAYTGKIEHHHEEGDAKHSEKHSSVSPKHTPELQSVESEAVGGTPFENELYLTAGGIYFDDDIQANGRTVPSVKFKGMHWKHDDVQAGDRICPVTQNKSESACFWIVNGKRYEFCCNPCIDKFVKWAKTTPDKIQEPNAYIARSTEQ